MKRQTWFIFWTYFLDICHCYENIAMKKPAFQQNPYFPDNDTVAASNAVDGRKTNLRWNGGQCAVSESGQTTATWWVNLTSIHSIHHITIYYLTNNQTWGPSNYLTVSFLGFSVYVSNTTNRLQGTLCFKDTNFTGRTIPAIFNITCTMHGQYVIYYNERLNNIAYPADYSQFAESDLCEVEVYGCPSTGLYGSNCSITCPDVNCRYCHIETGTCQGCKPGYEGHRCEFECPRGYFGDECSEKCSDNCYGCNSINGVCDSGCKPGWRGGFCHEVCLHGFYGQDCAKKCHGTCIGCNHINGSCVSGCQLGWMGTFCQEGCYNGSYGMDCGEHCGHCHDNDCHHVNGTCLSGCMTGYRGNRCKTQNIAIKKPTYQQTPFIPDNDTVAASNAVDGRKTNLMWDKGQCAVSASGQTAIWWVNLTSIHSIHHITIYYLTNNWIWGSSNYLARSFLGFSLYVSNTTNILQGTLCFKDTSFSASIIPTMFNTTCILHGQYVIYYNERLNNILYPEDYSEFADSYLCEVEVYGCPTTGFYGSNCSIPCPDVNCRYCHIETGTCQGCKPGYEGHRCGLNCPRGYFGEGCADKCSDKCNGCNHINGLCDSGCKPGWRGDYCQEVCFHGYFGQDCAQKCHDTCISCNHVNGSCVFECLRGWIGTFCDEECDEGFYGHNCSEKCGHCRDIKQCFHVDGICVTGCDAGFHGKLCKTRLLDCKEGSYGYNCNETCGHCRNTSFCLQINGTCVTGCKAGFTGEVCKMRTYEG